MTPGGGFFEALTGGADPAEVSEAADRAADAAGARRPRQPTTPRSPTGCSTSPTPRASRRSPRCGRARRPTRWPAACGGSTCCARGCTPTRSASPREFEAGRARAQVARVVAGVADPPGPDELKAMVDQVLRGIAGGDFADVLLPGRGVRAGRGDRPGRAADEHRGAGGPDARAGRAARGGRSPRARPRSGLSRHLAHRVPRLSACAGPRQPRVPKSAATSGHAP